MAQCLNFAGKYSLTILRNTLFVLVVVIVVVVADGSLVPSMATCVTLSRQDARDCSP